MKKVIADMLLDVAQERNGFSIGKPWRFTEYSLAAVVPLMRETKVESRPYRLFSEGENKLKITDTGNIERISITNKGEYPILIKAGEVLVGPTQSRTVTISQIVFPEEKLPVSCACVYSSKGIREGQGMRPGVYSPIKVRQTVLRGHYQGGVLGAGYRRNQDEIWGGVKHAARAMSASVESFAAAAGPAGPMGPSGLGGGEINTYYATPTEDLAGRVGETQEKLKEIIKKVPKVDHQVGIVLLTMTGLESMEAFEHPDSWEGFRRAFLGTEAAKIVDVSDQNGLFKFKAEKARNIIIELLTKDFAEKVAVNRERTQTYILDTDRFMGEVVLLDDSPIHFSFLRKEK